MTSRKTAKSVKKPARKPSQVKVGVPVQAMGMVSDAPWNADRTEYLQPRTKREKLLFEQAYYRGERYGREVGMKQATADFQQRVRTDNEQAKVRLIQAVGQTLDVNSQLLGNLARVLGN